MLRKWSCPNGFEIIFSEGELKVGGKFRSTMKSAQFEGTVVGVYKEIDEPKKLVFTHAWEQEDDGGHDDETLVTVELIDQGAKTEMIFTQTGFTSKGSRDGHEGGWSECFDKLSLQLSH